MDREKDNPDTGFPTSEQLKEFLARETDASEKTKSNQAQVKSVAFIIQTLILKPQQRF
jgi:hypothetical protein